ncbi:hypothetical protein ACFSSC_06190 [Corynebacterium mendelii]|uniref:Lipoprotein n=1 Tax=Corynebacterium mendelii TaxID=2765362 RepID=A0A939IU54_9CORY|nr:hypothetical protein [Corynebacterium mendelii]MBN9644569.1 hypothetical protein [Corynebacterium mendelii]
MSTRDVSAGQPTIRRKAPAPAVSVALAGLAVTGCALSSENATDLESAGPDMSAILNEAVARGTNPVEVHPAWLYPGEPTGFFIACPYLPRGSAEAITKVPLRQIPADGLDDSVNALVIVYRDNRTVVTRYPLDKINMCTMTGQQEEVFDSDSTIVFEPTDTGWQAVGFGHQTRAQTTD